MNDFYEEVTARLDSAQRCNFLAVVLRVARVDDVSTEELGRLRPAGVMMMASQEELMRAVQMANDETLSLAQIVKPISNFLARYLLFYLCCSIAWVDGYRTEGEGQIVDELACLLKIDEKSRAVMDTGIAGSNDGDREFLQLIELSRRQACSDSNSKQ